MKNLKDAKHRFNIEIKTDYKTYAKLYKLITENNKIDLIHISELKPYKLGDIIIN